MKAKEKNDEARRLKALHAYDILDTEEEEDLNDLTKLAAAICGTPIAFISLIDYKRQWFKSKFGHELKETPRSTAFGNHTIGQNDIFEVNDARDDIRFSENPLVIGDPNIRFYSGAPLVTEDGFKLGSLCVFDKVPKSLTSQQKNALRVLSRQVINHFELRRNKKALEREKSGLQETLELKTRELVQSNKELDRFVYSASHELRAPLKSILGLTHIALIDQTSNSQIIQEQYIKRIEGSVIRLDRLLSDIIDYSRNSRLDMFVEETDMAQILQNIFTDLCFLETIPLEKKLSFEGNCPFYCDNSRLTIVLSNIISNAFKYADKKKADSFISIKVKISPNNCKIMVEDNGIGIEGKYLKMVCNMFFRATHQGQGAGLGMYITQETLDKMKGKMKIISVVNKGTKIIIDLPNQSTING